MTGTERAIAYIAATFIMLRTAFLERRKAVRSPTVYRWDDGLEHFDSLFPEQQDPATRHVRKLYAEGGLAALREITTPPKPIKAKE